MPSAETEKKRIVYDWGSMLMLWGFQGLKLFYTSSALCFISLFLSLTPVLWSPSSWLSWLMISMQAVSEFAYLPDYEMIDAMAKDEVSRRCMTFDAKVNATQGPTAAVEVVNGWYGPGAYLAWLLTAYVAAFSSIWRSKCAQSQEGDMLDGEMVGALLYPMVALFDVFVRLVRCKVDAQMSAALFVLFSALMVFGPTSRLSWQVDGEDFDLEVFPKTNRSWAWKFAGFLVHGFVITLIGEPYAYTLELLLPVYIMIFAVMLYAPIHGERLSEEYPYTMTVYRPRAERVAVFGVLQIIFLSVAWGKIGSPVPITGASLWDMDQIAGLVSAVAALLFFRMSGVVSLVSEVRNRLAGFRQVAGDESGIELSIQGRGTA
ncbi:hypothetical protein QBC37DRAFT_430433 [Rhypophila decipiens]|uniref:Uncharacterized protein n=1 Tax=Rhypophila decipiens TaxID=261697 RepID=A0AAN6XYS2_9PEZI|nr:hypothetical protein QBC37DRAFT_430433 [Rhypophila decipiens]